MSTVIESRDCNLPAFTHSKYARLGYTQEECSGAVRLGSHALSLLKKDTDVVLVSMDTMQLTQGFQSPDLQTELDGMISNTSETRKCSIPIGDSANEKILLWGGESSSVCAVSVGKCVHIVSLGKDGALTVQRSHIVDSLPTLILLSADSRVIIITTSGRGYCASARSDEITTFSEDLSQVSSGTLLAPHKCLFVRGKDFLILDTVTKESKTCTVENLPEELVLEDTVIQAVTRLGSSDRIAFLATSESGLNIVVCFATLTTSSVTVSQFSANEIFITADWTSASTGFLQYIPELDIVLAGHSLADSVALYHSSRNGEDIGKWECLVMPEGKQLGCSYIEDASNSVLTRLTPLVLEEGVKAQKGHELFESRFVVITTQRGGWSTMHFADLPSDWAFNPVVRVEAEPALQDTCNTPAESVKVQPATITETESTPAPTVESKEPATQVVKESASTASKPSEVTGGLFGSFGKTTEPISFGSFGKPAEPASGNLFGQSNDTAATKPTSGGLFSQPIQAATATPGGLFGQTTGTAATTSGGLFGQPTDASAAKSVEPTTGGLFGKPPGTTAAGATSGGLFGKPSESTGLFAKPAEPPKDLFGKPVEPAVGLFAKPAESTSTGLFGKPADTSSGGIFGKPAETSSSGSNLFGSFGSFGKPAAQSAAASGDLFGLSSFEKSEAAAPAAAAPPMFNPTVKPTVGHTTTTPTTAAAAPPKPVVSTTAPTAAAPPMFNPSVKPAVAAAAPPMFNPSVKPVIGSTAPAPTTSAAAPPMFNPTVKPVIGTTAPAAASAPPMFNPTVKPVIGRTAEKPSASTAPPMFNPAVKPVVGSTASVTSSTPAKSLSASSVTEATSAPVDSSKASEAKAPVATTYDKIDASLVSSFESELKAFEALCKTIPSTRVSLEWAKRIPDNRPSVMEKQKDSLKELRDKAKSLDSELRKVYLQDSSELRSSTVSKYEDKIDSISARIDEANLNSKKLIPKSRKSTAAASPQVFAPSLANTSVPPSPTPITLSRPFPPSMRKDQSVGFGLFTPVKSREDLADFRGERFSKDPYISRIALGTSKTPVTSRRISLGDMLAGKPLGSPEVRSRPTAPDKAPARPSAGGHGAAWQILREVEKQRKEIDALMHEIEEIARMS